MSIPVSVEGYAVDVATGIVHRRWAEHAIGLARTRLASGVWSMLGREPIACPLCFGADVPVRATVTADDLDTGHAVHVPRYRRARALPEPVEEPGS